MKHDKNYVIDMNYQYVYRTIQQLHVALEISD